MTVMMKDAYHVRTGLTRMYAVDANTAVALHPDEWSLEPWSKQDAEVARKSLAERHAREVEDAKARGVPEPAPLPPEPAPLTPEEQKAIDEHTKAVTEARDRLDKFYAKQREEKKIADQVASDEILVASPPPQPDPNARRPLSPAQIRKRSATLTDEEIAAKKKEDENDQRNASQKAAEAQAEATKRERERERVAAGQSSPNPTSPVHNQFKTPQQIADEKAETDRISGARVHPST